MNDECYLMNEARYRREGKIKGLLIAHCLCLLLLPAAGMQPASSEWNERSAWSLLALNRMKEQRGAC